MENLTLDLKKRTPQINFKLTGEFSIIGNCFPEDPKEFFRPILAWIEEFRSIHHGEVNLTIDLKYVNTSSIKILLEIIQGIKSNFKSKTKIHWIYELDDEDMLGVGEDLEKIAEMEFSFQSKKSVGF